MINPNYFYEIKGFRKQVGDGCDFYVVRGSDLLRNVEYELDEFSEVDFFQGIKIKRINMTEEEYENLRDMG